MNDEIREILNNMFHIIVKYEEDFEDLEENEIRYQLPYKKMQKLYDYITNLEQENERLKKIRNKAICYNKELCKIYDCGMELSNAQTNLCILEDTETLNILQNGDDEE